jgi:hypothetical protein
MTVDVDHEPVGQEANGKRWMAMGKKQKGIDNSSVMKKGPSAFKQSSKTFSRKLLAMDVFLFISVNKPVSCLDA